MTSVRYVVFCAAWFCAFSCRAQPIDPTSGHRNGVPLVAIEDASQIDGAGAVAATSQLSLAQVTSAESSLRTLPGNTPREVREGKAILESHYEPERMLRLSFVLTPSHLDEERQFLEDIQNKQSPHFHQYLSGEEWVARFGPSVQDETAVAAWAQAQGLTVVHRYPDRMLVDVEAPARTIENALQVTINHYKLPAQNGLEERSVFSNDRDPALPASVAGVVRYVAGLNSILVMRPGGGAGPIVPQPDYTPGPPVKELESAQRAADSAAVIAVKQGQPLTPSLNAPNAALFTPAKLWDSTAYDYMALMNQGHCCNPLNNPVMSPPETSIAIAAFGDLAISDVDNFAAGFPYLTYNFRKIAIQGGYTCQNAPKTPDANCGEVTLDTEWAIASANSSGAPASTAFVYVYEATGAIGSNSIALFTQMVNDGYARTMTTSWGINEGDPDFAAAQDYIFSEMVGRGWTLVAASGDQGATAGCANALVVQSPASDPNVVGVGGTELNEVAGANYEIAWTGSTASGSCSKNQGGSTGGFSAEFLPAPSYQSGLGLSTRAVPDVALDSSHGHDVYFLNGWTSFAGTSVAAPMMAGFFAQENAYLLSLGNVCGDSGNAPCAPLGNANFPLYALGKTNFTGTSRRSPFYDIVSGCNSNDITVLYGLQAYCAGPGYDEVTGWGSANMLQLAWGINYQLGAAHAAPQVAFAGPPTGRWYNTNHNVNWAVIDNTGNVQIPGTGIAGETAGWDSIPADPVSQPHGGVGNSFYSGPQYVNQTNGCIALVAGGDCAGGVSQGCHTLHVEAWNNQGLSSGDNAYGPLCFDNVAPTIAAVNNPSKTNNGWTTSALTATLSANDPGGSGASGVADIFYGVNNPACAPSNLGACQQYDLPIIYVTEGIRTLTIFSRDYAGNYSPVITDPIKIDYTAPVTTATISGTMPSGTSYYDSFVQVTLHPSDNLSGVETTFYRIDGGAETNYSGPITITTPGIHSIAYSSVDYAGNFETTHTLTVTMKAPTSTVLFVSPNPSTKGQAVTLTADVFTTLSGTPQGLVTFMNGSKILGSDYPVGGSLTITTSNLPVGQNALTAVFQSAGSYLPSTSSAVNETVRLASTTRLDSSARQLNWGQPVTLKATVKPSSQANLTSIPTGTVYFRYGLNQLGSALLNSSGVAILATTALPVGNDGIDATYSGDSNYGPSGSISLNEAVIPTPTTTKLQVSANPIDVLAPVTFTIKVATSYTAAPPPSGTVYLKKVGATLATALTLTNGTATYTASGLPVGTTTFVATYEGAHDYAASTSNTIAEVVEPLTNPSSSPPQ